MLVKLNGYKNLDFVTEEGNAIKGTQLFVSYAEEGVVGEMTDKLFLRDGLALPALTVGAALNVEFNRKGKVIGVQPVNSAKP